MKKTIIYTLCIAAIATSCAKEIEISNKEDSSENQLGSLESVTIIASTPSTKTSVDALGQYSWTDNETILVADGTDTPKTFTIDNNNKDKGYFSGSKSGDLRYAVSPVDVLPATLLYDSGSEDLLNLPAEYNYVEGKTNSTMIAGTPSIVGEKYQFEFRHVGSLMKYTIANVPIRTKYFKLTTDQNIAGDEIAFDASKVTEIATSDITTNASKSIVINLPHAVSKANQTMSFYVPVPTGTYNTVKAQLCMANDDVLAEKNKTISGGLELNRTDIFAAPTISLATATITKGNEYKFEFGGSKKFSDWGSQVSQNSMTWVLDKINVEASATPGNWDGSSRGQQIGTGSSPKRITKVKMTAIDYADFCESSTAVGINEVHVKAGAANGTTITCTVSVGGVAMTAKSTNSDKYTAASTLPGTMTFSSESLLTGDIEITYQLSSAGALYINDISINPDLRTPVTLSFANSAVGKSTENYGSFTGQTVTASPDVSDITDNITYSKSDPSNIIDSFNASTGELTLNGTEGTATITATFPGDGTYKSANKSYVISVADVDGITGTWATWASSSDFSISENIASSEVAGDFCGTNATIAAYNSSNVIQSLVSQSSGSFYMLRYDAYGNSYWKIRLPVSKRIPAGTTISISYYHAINSGGITSWTVKCNGNTCGKAVTITENGSPSKLSDMTHVERSYTLTADVAKNSVIEFTITAGTGTHKNNRLTNIVVSAAY